MKYFIIVILLKVIVSASFKKDICEQCIPTEKCQAFTNMNRHDQDSWTQQFPCDDQQDNKTISVFGFAAVAKGDFVCCPSSPVWGVNNLGPNSHDGNKIASQNSNVKNFNSKDYNDNSMNNKTDPAIKPEYGNFENPPNRGRNPYLYGNQYMPNNQNPYANQQFNPQNPNLYGGQENYPNQNMYGNQRNMPNNQIGLGYQQPGVNGGLGYNVPANQGIYGGQENLPPSQGFLGNGQIPDNQNIYGGQPTEQNINSAYRPGLNENPYGGLQNRPINQFPFGGQQNRPINQNPYNYPQYGNEPTYPGSNINGVPWGNQRISPGYQNNPQANVPSEVQPGNLGPGLPSTTNLSPGFQNNPRTRFPNQVQRVNPAYPSTATPNNVLGLPNNPQTSLPNQVRPGIINPSLPSTGNQNSITPGYQNNPQTNLPNLIQPGVLNPSLPSTINQNPSYQSNTAYPNQNQNSFGNDVDDTAKPSLGQECKRMKTSFSPSPETGCCGRDMSDAERVTDLQSLLNMFAPPKQNTWNQPRYPQRRNWPSTSWPSYQRKKRSVKNVTTDVSLDNRIAGGRETELDQFPWTVLMKTTFDYSNKVAAFSCGGSLISRRYVLTAGHCVYEPKARISSVEVTLAEYDKRTFPIDCITVFGGGRECVKNILMYAEDVVHHPEYDDDRLLNDIALVRLNDFAPYTRYIRPICLPTINIDIPEFSNLPLAVAGWGRDHQYVTDIKQSTIVHLVPPDDCKKSYPHLSKDHLCAAGRTGEDTCKGDSGGPLMMLYKGSYYVIGVVSGKRADSPCGSKVPSLYTNVYHYVSWIRNTIRE